MMVHRPLRLMWQPEPVGFSARLTLILERWENVPYADQIPTKEGASCMGLSCAVLDELYGIDDGEHLVGLPPDVALKTPETARSAMRWFKERYEVERIEDGTIQPGDLVVVTPGNGNTPSHLLMVGPRKNTLWHTVEDLYVHYIGMSLPVTLKHHSTYRCKDRSSWARN